jgi:glutamate---cysteine ligase / carboxylate-amine ligase
VMNKLRAVLPEVLALSVNSPFFDGRDTGLESWRHSLLGRYPRMGIPDIWPDEDAYFAHIESLRRLGSIGPDRGMWDDLRLHHRYGTLEVRICDAVFSLERIWLIVALLQCETMTLVEEARRGALGEPEPRIWIEENKWRARRYGMAANFIDWRRNENVAAPVRYERWLARILPAAMTLGIWPRVELAVAAALQDASPAAQQRAWRTQTGSFEGLVNALVDATAEPWIVPPSIRRHRDAQKPSRTRKPRPVSPANLRTGRASP